MTHTGRLGFHVIGVPVVLLRSDVLARHAPEVWADHDPPRPEEAAYERFLAEATIRHEVRHFHDALLCRPLYDRFLVEAERNAIAAAILGGRDGQEDLVARHQSHVRDLAHQHAEAYLPADVPGVGSRVTLVELLEASALVSEVAYLDDVLDEGAYGRWITLHETLPPAYTRIIACFVQSKETFRDDLRLLARVLAWCLFRSRPSAALLTEPARLVRLARHAAPARERINALCSVEETTHHLTSSDENRLFALFQMEFPPDQPRLFTGVEDMFALRDHGAAAMIVTGYDPFAYAREVRAFPIPATGFFADKNMVRTRRLPFVRKADLRKSYGEVFSLGSVKDQQRRATLSCGYIPTLGMPPCLELNRVDLMLSLRFMTQRVFGDKVSYNYAMDEVYALLHRDRMG